MLISARSQAVICQQRTAGRTLIAPGLPG